MKRLTRLFSFSAAVVIVLGSIVGTARGNAKDCFPSKMGRTPTDPGELPLWHKAMEAAGIDSNACGISLRPWPHESDAYVLYVENPIEYNIVDHQLVLLRKKSETFEVVARHRTDKNPYVFKSFDFARYAIRKGTIAIGVRMREYGPTIGGGYECIRLVLFERVRAELNPIFSATADQSAEGNEVAYDLDTSFEMRATATFILGKPGPSGYKQIVRKADKHRMVFSWDGSEYVPEGAGVANCLGDHCYCKDGYQ